MNPQGKPKIVDQKYAVEVHKNKLGNGSYGEVYLAHGLDDPATKLACKVLSKKEIKEKVARSDCADKEEALKYIIKSTKNEISICQKTSHPNIVRFIYFSETVNNIYLFMEYCDGGDLADFINERGALEGIAALKMIKGIVSAVSFLYDHNILHRDIKPQNVLLCKGIPKLADFGFAKEASSDKDVKQTGTNIGTLLYMAPQLIFEENPHYSIKCDVWSVGVLMYFILYGHLPWMNVENFEKFKLTLKAPIYFPAKSSVPASLKNCISKALIFSEEDRISIKKLEAEIDLIIQTSSEMDTQ